MKTLGLTMKGKIWAQVLNTLPDYETEDIGRIITCRDTGISYIGGSDTWMPITLYDKCINNTHLNYSHDINDNLAINASKIPASKDGEDVSIQDAINLLYNDIENLRNGKDLQDGVLGNRHINGGNYPGFTAEDMFIRNLHSGFRQALPYYLSVEGALKMLDQRRADEMLLPKDNSIGAHALGKPYNNIYETLLDIEKYLRDLNADQIEVDVCCLDVDHSWCSETTLQSYLNNVCGYLKNFAFTDLVDVPDGYGACGQYLRTCGGSPETCNGCGGDPIQWSKIYAGEVECISSLINGCTRSATPQTSNIQATLTNIEQCLQSIQSSLSSLSSRVSNLESHWYYN